MSDIFIQFFMIVCFISLIVVLFKEKKDYLSYCLLIVFIASAVTSIFEDEVASLDYFVQAIEFEVIIFLLSMFVIVEILNEKMIFHEISKKIIFKYHNNLRILFYVFCTVSTLIASVLEDLSVAIIFSPIIIITCKELKINPTPYLLGMTICINLASTLTPFGSAENILIVNSFDLDFIWFIKNFGLFFIFATLITLVLLDKLILRKYLNEREEILNQTEDLIGEFIKYKQEYSGSKEISIEEFYQLKTKESIEKLKDNSEYSQFLTNPEGFCKSVNNEKNLNSKTFYQVTTNIHKKLDEYKTEPGVFKKNIIALIIFILSLVIIPNLYIPSIIGLILFVFINPITDENGKKYPGFSHYFNKIDTKLVIFFICLFILADLLVINGVMLHFENFLIFSSELDLFVLSLIILFSTSILSAFMDNAPVTILFIPIIGILIEMHPESGPILMFSFILGINLGGNILPQGSACDMMTLEIAQDNHIKDMSYKKLFKVGALFALLHILIGIGYLSIMIFVI